MKGYGHGLQLAATDLSNHLACAHLTSLSLADAAGEIHGGRTNYDPLLDILRERGRAHERAFLAHLQRRHLRVESGDTRALMSAGVDVIYQAAMTSGRWSGVADFLLRVETPSALGAWSYEVVDTKLSTETKASVVLQLCVYTDLVGSLQGTTPVSMHVVTPGEAFPCESFRFVEYAAIYRAIKLELETRADASTEVSTYPEPTPHCDSCSWRTRCETQRRGDDHLSLVADMGRTHRRELARHGIVTLAALGAVASPWSIAPQRGSVASYEKLRLQAALQLESRDREVPRYELLATEPERGLTRLPAPSRNDMFLDLEGDPFIGSHGREYLFGWSSVEGDYHATWAFDDQSERAALESLLATIAARWADDPNMHVYHYAPYEPAALKRLVGRFAIGREVLDRLLRGRRFVDLYALVRQTARIGIESYSIKHLEKLIGYRRAVALEVTGPFHHLVRLTLQRGWREPDPEWLANVEAYNRDDCGAAAAVRTWLEDRRDEQVAAGNMLARPPLHDGAPDEVAEPQTRAAQLAQRLVADLPISSSERTVDQQARWLLGYAMEWFRREDAVSWWEFFRLAGTSDEERMDEPHAIAGLEHLQRIVPKRGNPIDRYRFPDQDCLLRVDAELRSSDEDEGKIGSIAAIDFVSRTVDIKRTKKSLDRHPSSCFAHDYVSPKAKLTALLEVGARVAEHGFEPSLVCELLFRARPRGTSTPLRREGETLVEAATRLALELDGGVLPFQGPPGTGKTHTAAEIILALVAAGKRVGVTATSHAVIENLVVRTAELAASRGRLMRIAVKSDEAPNHPGVESIADPKEAARRMPELDVLGATCWQWAHDDMRQSVDALIIDEAGQLCLADAIAVTVATRNLILVGDPQQLEQPMKGTHPDGVAVSVLQHVIGESPTIDPERGVLLDTTHRLHPAIAAFTSEQFYASRLRTAPAVEAQRIRTPRLSRAGLYWLPVEHRGNQNSSAEEADVVAALVASSLGGVWTDREGGEARIGSADVLVVAPYNAHLTAIRSALAARDLGEVRVGTVDKFQGREAAIAIYSMATSLPEDAPRGLGFLYDRHRLNVATSRARCACVLVASPALLRPACATPHHLHLASAMARYVEMATSLEMP